MSVVYIQDAAGKTIIVHSVDGRLYPTFNPDFIRGVSSLQLRDDDVILCSFPKSVAYGSWFDYVLEWETIIANNQELSILDLTYEDLKEHPIKEIRRLSDFLGVQRNEDFFEEMIEFCNFSTMKNRFKDKMGIKYGHDIFYRRGEVGDWKNWFTVAQNEWFDQLYREKFKFTLNED